MRTGAAKSPNARRGNAMMLKANAENRKNSRYLFRTAIGFAPLWTTILFRKFGNTEAVVLSRNAK